MYTKLAHIIAVIPAKMYFFDEFNNIQIEVSFSI